MDQRAAELDAAVGELPGGDLARAVAIGQRRSAGQRALDGFRSQHGADDFPLRDNFNASPATADLVGGRREPSCRAGRDSRNGTQDNAGQQTAERQHLGWDKRSAVPPE